MRSFRLNLIVVLLAIVLIAVFYLLRKQEYKPLASHVSNQEEVHDARLFSSGDVTLKLLLFEQGMPPHFRGYLYKGKQLILPKNAELSVQLQRFSGEKEYIGFIPVGEFLQSKEKISEPHSFDVAITLKFNGQKYQWRYSSHEGRITIVPAMISAAGIKTAVAQSRIMEKKLVVVGKITSNQNTLAPIYPRYSGIVKAMTKNLGDEVSKGENLATIESNESLQNYTLYAPITGTVVEKQATIGQLAKGDKPIYEIANLNTVWADLTLYRKDASLVKKGMKVTVTGDDGVPQASALIDYISPLGIEDSQTILARAVLGNQSQEWLPGMYVNAAITLMQKNVSVAVPVAALQQWHGQDIVFIQQGDQFEATPVLLGERNEEWVEVLSGLKPGQHYVTENSFFLKADLGKSGASHEH